MFLFDLLFQCSIDRPTRKIYIFSRTFQYFILMHVAPPPLPGSQSFVICATKFLAMFHGG